MTLALGQNKKLIAAIVVVFIAIIMFFGMRGDDTRMSQKGATQTTIQRYTETPDFTENRLFTHAIGANIKQRSGLVQDTTTTTQTTSRVQIEFPPKPHVTTTSIPQNSCTGPENSCIASPPIPSTPNTTTPLVSTPTTNGVIKNLLCRKKVNICVASKSNDEASIAGSTLMFALLLLSINWRKVK